MFTRRLPSISFSMLDARRQYQHMNLSITTNTRNLLHGTPPQLMHYQYPTVELTAYIRRMYGHKTAGPHIYLRT